MVDREKVIKGLHCCSHTDGVNNCIYCPYDIRDADCTALMSMDVLELLKEQEAKPPLVRKCTIKLADGEDGTFEEYRCPHCEEVIAPWYAPHYPRCMWCGQEIKWEEEKTDGNHEND